MYKNVHNIELLELMEKYHPVYPESNKWEDTIELLLNDPYDNEVVELLQEDFKKYGTYREPITICEDEDSDNPEPYVANGTHRVVAAYLNNAKTVPVAYYDSEFDFEDDIMVVTSITFAENDENLIEEIASSIRSFKINDETWMTNSGYSSNNNSLEITWDNYESGMKDIIHTTVSSRLRKLFPATEMVIETWYEKF